MSTRLLATIATPGNTQGVEEWLNPATQAMSNIEQTNERNRTRLGVNQDRGQTEYSGLDIFNNTAARQEIGSDLAQTARLWSANALELGAPAAENAFNWIGRVGSNILDMFGDESKREEAIAFFKKELDGLQSINGDTFNAVVNGINGMISEAGLDIEPLSDAWNAVGTGITRLVTLPFRFTANLAAKSAELIQLGITDPERFAEEAQKTLKETQAALKQEVDNLTETLQQMGTILKGSWEVGKQLVGGVWQLVKTAAMDYGFGEILEGIKNGDWKEVATGLAKFAGELTGASDLWRSVEAARRGDFIGFSMNLAFGIAGVAGTVATLGTANAAIAGAKAAIKQASRDILEKGFRELTQEVGETVMKQATEQVQEKLGKSLVEMQQEFAEKIANEARENIVKALKNPTEHLDLLRKAGLDEHTLGFITSETAEKLDPILKQKLEQFVKEEVRKKTEQYSKQLLAEGVEEILRDSTRSAVKDSLDNLMALSDEDLLAHFKKLTDASSPEFKEELMELFKGDTLPRWYRTSDPDKVAKAYAQQIRSKLLSGELDDTLVKVYTDVIHERFTKEMRETFHKTWDKNVDEMLEELGVVNQNIRKELSESWKKAGREGFEEGLEPIRKVIREEVEKEFKRRRRKSDDDNSSDIAIGESKQPTEEALEIEDNSILTEVHDQTSYRAKVDNNSDLAIQTREQQIEELREQYQRQQEQELQKLTSSLQASSSTNKTSSNPGSAIVPSANPAPVQVDSSVTAAHSPEDFKDRVRAKENDKADIENLPEFFRHPNSQTA